MLNFFYFMGLMTASKVTYTLYSGLLTGVTRNSLIDGKIAGFCRIMILDPILYKGFKQQILCQLYLYVTDFRSLWVLDDRRAKLRPEHASSTRSTAQINRSASWFCVFCKIANAEGRGEGGHTYKTSKGEGFAAVVTEVPEELGQQPSLPRYLLSFTCIGYIWS